MATNTLGAYNPIFYATEALIHLRKRLGMAARVHRGYELERASYNRSDTIRIRKPSTFIAQNAPSAAQDMATGTTDLILNQWKEVKVELLDKDAAYTNDIIIQEHIDPMAYALADNVDTALSALSLDIPWTHDYATATDHTILTGARRILFDNNVPVDDGRMHFMVNGTVEAHLLNSAVFHSAQVTGGAVNQETLLRGGLGTRFGVETFSNQNVKLHAPGTALRSGGDVAGAVNNGAGYAAGTTTMAVDGFTGSETVLTGDTFSIAGDTQKYVLTADTTMSTGAGNITFAPGLAAAVADNAVITFSAMVATDTGATTVAQNLMFHRNAFALALAPLPDNLPGAESFTATDPVSGLSVRARRYYEGANSKLFMALDILCASGHKAPASWQLYRPCVSSVPKIRLTIGSLTSRSTIRLVTSSGRSVCLLKRKNNQWSNQWSSPPEVGAVVDEGMATKRKSPRQVRFLLSKSSPLSSRQRTKLKKELHSGAVKMRKKR
jgi:hypothetical protein